MRWRWLAQIAALSVAILSSPRRLHAWELDYDAPGGCTDAAALRERVAETLGDAPVDHGARVRVRILAEPGGFAVDVEVWTSGGERLGARRISATTCAEVISGVALGIALTLEAARESALPPDEMPVAHSPLRHGWRFGLGVGTALDTGILPSSAAAWSAATFAAHEQWSSELDLTSWGSKRVHLDGGTAGIELRLWAMELRGCRALGRLRLCASYARGRMNGASFGLMEPTQGGAWWSAVGLVVRSPELRILEPLGGFAVEAGVVVPVERPRFLLDGRPVHEAGPAARFALVWRCAIF